MSDGGETKFMKKAYAAYAGFMRSLVKEDNVWKLKKGEVVVASLIGEKPEVMSPEEYRNTAGQVALSFYVHIDAVDGFGKNRALSSKTVSSFDREFRIRGFLQHEPIYGVLLCDGMLVNDSGVTVVTRSGVFSESICEVEKNLELSIVVVGGNHRMKALKALGSNFSLGCEDDDVRRDLTGLYTRGNRHGGFYPMKVICCPPDVGALVEWASLENIKNNVSCLE